MWNLAIRLLKSEKGTTAIEYTLIVTVIACAIIPSLTNIGLGPKLIGVFNKLATSL
jgi:Flp pilus assembly pilin Flp